MISVDFARDAPRLQSAGRAVEFREHGGAHLDPCTPEPDAEPGAELQHGFDEQRRKGHELNGSVEVGEEGDE